MIYLKFGRVGSGQWAVGRKLLVTCHLSLVTILLVPYIALAQVPEVSDAPRELRAVITGPSNVSQGKKILLDASHSTADPDTVSYKWLRDGQAISTSEEALLTLNEPGKYKITLQVSDLLNNTKREAEVTQDITVYKRKLILVAGPNVEKEKLALHQSNGEEKGVLVDIMHAEALTIPLGTEDVMTKMIAENTDRFLGAEAIILWADGATAMNALSRALQQDEETLSLIGSQTIVLIPDGGLQQLSRVIQGPFSVLDPEKIVITRKEAINPLIEVGDVHEFVSEIEKRDIDFSIVDEATFAIRPWNILSTLVNYMVTKGVSSEMIILLLMLPLILTIITFLKQVVGVTTFGLYTPAVITLSLVALGWEIGLVLLAVILFAGYLTRAFMKRYRLLYFPKIATILTVISLVLLVVLAVAASFGITLAPDTIFILLIMATLSEEFMSVKAEMGLRNALMAVGETVIVALVCFVIVQWAVLKSLIIAYPETVFLTIVVNIFLGKWTGLRLSETLRFKEIFRYMEE